MLSASGADPDDELTLEDGTGAGARYVKALLSPFAASAAHERGLFHAFAVVRGRGDAGSAVEESSPSLTESLAFVDVGEVTTPFNIEAEDDPVAESTGHCADECSSVSKPDGGYGGGRRGVEGDKGGLC